MNEPPELVAAESAADIQFQSADFLAIFDAADRCPFAAVDPTTVVVPQPNAYITDTGTLTILCHTPACAERLAAGVRPWPELARQVTVDGRTVTLPAGASDMYTIVGWAGLYGLADIPGVRPAAGIGHRRLGHRSWAPLVWRPVRAGQVWEDRRQGRTVLVTAINDTQTHAVVVSAAGRTSRIRLDRLIAGLEYRLVRDV
jgi:hypothetical protein